MIKTEQLDITLESKKILSDISVSFETGKFFSILGPNGAGKSTLLKALSGDIDFVQNQVEMENKLLSDYSPKEMANHRSVMPQSIHLDFPFLVSEIIEMSLLENVAHQDREKYVIQALELFDVVHLKDRNYLTLSGGEQQRVQLSRVLAQITLKKDQTPRYLFLDECTSSLDLAHQHQVFERVREIVEEANICAIVVLHDLNLASQYSDELILMQNGQIVKKGDKDEVLTSELIESVYDFAVEIMPHPKGWPMVIPK